MRRRGHRCAPPVARWPWAVPTAAFLLPEVRPEGMYGDLWRCGECRALWRVGDACLECDRRGGRDHEGGHTPGLAWRRARWWQRVLGPWMTVWPAETPPVKEVAEQGCVRR